MSLTNPTKAITEERLKDFYDSIYPYLGGMPEMLANKFSKGDLYSTDEKMIGCYTDGKPLYQKVVTGSISANNTYTTLISTLIPNIGSLLSNVILGSPDNGILQPLPIMNASYTAIKLSADVKRKNTDTQISIVNGWEANAAYYAIILQYTKTTDSPISIGSESDYDSTEKIVGTWFGEWLYQKTINFGTLPDNTLKTVSTGLTNVHVLCCSGQTYRPSDGSSFPIPYASTVSTEVIKCGTRNNGASIEIGTGMDRTAFTETYVTLLYTKTS